HDPPTRPPPDLPRIRHPLLACRGDTGATGLPRTRQPVRTPTRPLHVPPLKKPPPPRHPARASPPASPHPSASNHGRGTVRAVRAHRFASGTLAIQPASAPTSPSARPPSACSAPPTPADRQRSCPVCTSPRNPP